MRIATSKLYRAFEELDHLTDDQCERLIRRVRNERLNALKTGCLSVGAMIGAIILFSAVFAAIMTLGNEWFDATRDRQELGLWIAIIGFIGVPAFTGLITRDHYLRRQLLIALHDYIERVRCLNCQYILLGLPAESGRVTCSECGHTMTLESLGATEKDLIPPSEGETSAKRFEQS